MGDEDLVELAKDDGRADSAHHADEQPRDTGARLLPDGIGRLDVLGNTGGQLIVAFRLFAHLVHDVVDGNLSHQPPDAVHHRHGHQVVFLNHLHHLVDGCIDVAGDEVLVHHVLHLGDAGAGNHLLQREEALQALLVVDDIDVVDIVHVLGLLAHLAQALGHGPVLVDDNHFRTHQTAGGVLVVLQQVNDVARLFDVLDVRKHLFLLFLVEVTDDIDGIVGIHGIDELAGDGLRGEVVEQFRTFLVVHLDQRLGSRLVIQQVIDITGILTIQFLRQLGNVGRVHLGQRQLQLIGIASLDERFHLAEKLIVKLSMFLQHLSIFLRFDDKCFSLFAIQERLHIVRQLDEFSYGELLGPSVEQRVGKQRTIHTHDGLDAVPKRFAALVEGGLHDAPEERLVAAQFGSVVPLHADDGTLHLRRRVEDMLVHREQVLHVVPRLNKDGKDTIGLAPWPGSQPLRHLTLNHACAGGDAVAVVEHLEEYLAGDIIRIVAGEHEGTSVEKTVEVHFQEVVLHDALLQLGIRLAQVADRFVVNLHYLQLALFGNKELGEHAHPGAYLKNGIFREAVDSICYGFRNGKILQEVLSQRFLWVYWLHSVGYLYRRPWGLNKK